MISFKSICLYSLICLLTQTTCAQQRAVKQESVWDRSKSEQRRYVELCLDQDSREWKRGRNGKRSLDIGNLLILARTNSWVIPMLEDKIREWLKDSNSKKDLIESISYAIAGAGSQAALDAVMRLFSDRPEAPRLIRMALLSGVGYSFHNHYTLWYYALDSPNQELRDAAVNTIADHGNDPTDWKLRLWAEAAIERYGHPPMDSEWLSDPILKMAWAANPTAANANQMRLSKLIEEAFRKRQSAVQK